MALAKNFRVMAHGMYGSGIGRYMMAQAPTQWSSRCKPAPRRLTRTSQWCIPAAQSSVWKPPQARASSASTTAASTSGKITSLIRPTRCLGRRAGFGGANSPNAANRAIQEGTIDWIQTFWKNPQYGAVLMVTQASYLTRSPWFVATGAPKNAHLGMGYLSIRYVLP